MIVYIELLITNYGLPCPVEYWQCYIKTLLYVIGISKCITFCQIPLKSSMKRLSLILGWFIGDLFLVLFRYLNLLV